MSTQQHQHPEVATLFEKTAIRRELLRQRRALGRGEWVDRSLAIRSRLVEMDALRKAGKIHCYLSMEAEREVSTEGLPEWLCSERKMVDMPYIAHGRMAAARYVPGLRFTKPRIGPPVPDPLVISDATGYDLVIVPLVGSDRRGGRIGFGKGWYDRFFEEMVAIGSRPVKVGLAFGFQVLDRLPSDPWDQPLDMVVTETEIINCFDGKA